MDAQQYGEKAGLKNMNNLSNIDPALFAKRKRANKLGLTLSMIAMVLGMVFLFWILFQNAQKKLQNPPKFLVNWFSWDKISHILMY